MRSASAKRKTKALRRGQQKREVDRSPRTPSKTEIELGPTAERFGQLYGVERHDKQISDEEGRPSQPYRSIDILAVMERRGAIDSRQRDAGERFRDTFARAHLDPLRAPDLLREAGHNGRGPEVGVNAESARESVYRALSAVGEPGGSCLWQVLGFGFTVKEWCHLSDPVRNQQEANGILQGALGCLASYYRL